MLLLISGATSTVRRLDSERIGELHSPRTWSAIEGRMWWAADNDCFQGLDTPAYERMLARCEGRPNCLFVVAPDVVADAAATIQLWGEWSERLRKISQPVAFVLQDGQEDKELPLADAYFIGGSTSWKESQSVRDLSDEVHRRYAWLHMGRVNTLRRLQYAWDIGCDSVDGTGMSRWPDTIIPRMLGWIRRIEAQGRLW